LTLKNKLTTLWRHPEVIKEILKAKKREDIREKVRRLNQKKAELREQKEVYNFLSSLKKSNSVKWDYERGLNRLCCIEDWETNEFRKIIDELHNASLPSYLYRKDWKTTARIIGIRKPGFIHRKDWEWARGIISMCKLNKLNKESTAIGVGTGREEVLFYLANKLKHVYATDLYDGKNWENYAPSDFPENPKKYAPFPYKTDSLSVLRMDGKNIEFPSESFDVAFSFSSIEHFGGSNHEGALKSLREIERVLRTGGIAVIATEFIINGKQNPEFFNNETIYSDIINKLPLLKLVDPLDLNITNRTLDTVLDYSGACYWDTSNDYVFKKKHPLILIKLRNILLTSVLLVFKKY
jgi:SAM-dependent methyltransferase